jgi:hypothetical protein
MNKIRSTAEVLARRTFIYTDDIPKATFLNLRVGGGGKADSRIHYVRESKVVCEIRLLNQPLLWSSTAILKWIFFCMTARFLIWFVQQQASIPTIIRGVSRLIIAQPPRYVTLMRLHASPQKPVTGALTGASSQPSTPRYHNGERGFPTEILWMWCLLTVWSENSMFTLQRESGMFLVLLASSTSTACKPSLGPAVRSSCILPTERTAMVGQCLPQTPGRTTLAPFRAATGWLVPGKRIYTCTEYRRRPRPLATSVIWDYAKIVKREKVIANTVHPR